MKLCYISCCCCCYHLKRKLKLHEIKLRQFWGEASHSTFCRQGASVTRNTFGRSLFSSLEHQSARHACTLRSPPPHIVEITKAFMLLSTSFAHNKLLDPFTARDVTYHSSDYDFHVNVLENRSTTASECRRRRKQKGEQKGHMLHEVNNGARAMPCDVITRGDHGELNLLNDVQQSMQ